MATLKVIVHEARDLPIMNRTTGLTDPYVTLKLDDTEFSTEIIPRTRHPVWNSDFRFSIPDLFVLQEDPLEVRVYDQDIISRDDIIGIVLIDCNCILYRSDPVISGWFPLYDTNAGLHGDIRLTLRIKFHASNNPLVPNFPPRYVAHVLPLPEKEKKVNTSINSNSKNKKVNGDSYTTYEGGIHIVKVKENECASFTHTKTSIDKDDTNYKEVDEQVIHDMSECTKETTLTEAEIHNKPSTTITTTSTNVSGVGASGSEKASASLTTTTNILPPSSEIEEHASSPLGQHVSTCHFTNTNTNTNNNSTNNSTNHNSNISINDMCKSSKSHIIHHSSNGFGVGSSGSNSWNFAPELMSMLIEQDLSPIVAPLMSSNYAEGGEEEGILIFSVWRLDPFVYRVEAMFSMVEELIVKADPEHSRLTNLRSVRSTNEARLVQLYKLSGKVRRQLARKVIEMHCNAVIGYVEQFDMEPNGIIVRAYGTPCVISEIQVAHEHYLTSLWRRRARFLLRHPSWSASFKQNQQQHQHLANTARNSIEYKSSAVSNSKMKRGKHQTHRKHLTYLEASSKPHAQENVLSELHNTLPPVGTSTQEDSLTSFRQTNLPPTPQSLLQLVHVDALQHNTPLLHFVTQQNSANATPQLLPSTETSHINSITPGAEIDAKREAALLPLPKETELSSQRTSLTLPPSMATEHSTSSSAAAAAPPPISSFPLLVKAEKAGKSKNKKCSVNKNNNNNNNENTNEEINISSANYKQQEELIENTENDDNDDNDDDRDEEVEQQMSPLTGNLPISHGGRANVRILTIKDLPTGCIVYMGGYICARSVKIVSRVKSRQVIAQERDA